MLVKSWMTKNIVTIDENETVDAARKLLRDNKFHMLPVMKQGKLAGVITCRDIIDEIYPYDLKTEGKKPGNQRPEIFVKDIMTKDFVTVSTDFTIEEVADVLLVNNVFSTPVINREGEMAGIITHSDLARALICLAGGNKGGIFYGFMLEDRPGSIKEIADIIRDHGGRLASILTSIEGVPYGFRKVYIRVYGIDRFRVRKLNEMLEQNSDVFKISERPEIRREFQLPDTKPTVDSVQYKHKKLDRIISNYAKEVG